MNVKVGTTVGVLDRTTRDWVLFTPLERASAVLSKFRLPMGTVSYLNSREELLRVARELGGRDLPWSSGGTASNVIYNMGLIQGGIAVPLRLSWFGNCGPHDPREVMGPLDTLRRVAITPYCRHHDDEDAVALIIVDEHAKSTLAILVSRGERLVAEESWPSQDVLVIGLDGYLNAHESVARWAQSCGRIALLIDRRGAEADVRRVVTQRDFAVKVGWVIGRAEDIADYGLLQQEPPPALQHAEIVGTAGADPVVIWDPERSREVGMTILSERRPLGDDVGAGDAYAAGYLHGRLAGKSIAGAHNLARTRAALVLDQVGARLPPPVDLNNLFGRLINRRSSYPNEGHLFETVRKSHGLTVVTGGQTGVDQIGLASAGALGLAAFGIVPRGGRTEVPDGPLLEDRAPFDARVVELGSESFRYRTWANCHLTDGTLIWDLHGGPGSEATRQGCRTLGRPWLDLAGRSREEAREQVRSWAARHRIRILNLAGNRGSLLGPGEANTIRDEIDDVLSCLARAWTRLNATRAETTATASSGRTERNLRLGVTDAEPVRLFIDRFLRERLGGPRVPSRALVARSDARHVELAYFRARELPDLLGNSFVDGILCGLDVIEESGIDFTILLNTGLFNQLLALVGKPPASGEGRDHPTSIVSQYPRLAKKVLASVLPEAEVRPIRGSAEAWLALDLADAAFDTWRTGRTAAANGLDMLMALDVTSLVFASSPERLSKRPEDISTLVDDLDRWLGC